MTVYIFLLLRRIPIAGVKHPPPKTASAEPEEKPTAGFPHDNDLIHLLVKDIRDAQYVTDIRNLRGLYSALPLHTHHDS